MATATIVRCHFIGGQVERGEDGAEKQPRTEIARHHIGVLALPPEPRFRRQRLFHHGGGIDEHLQFAARSLDHPAGERLQGLLDDVMIVGPLRINRDAADPRFPRQPHRILARRIAHPQHDQAPRLGPKPLRPAALVLAGLHPHHRSMRARRQPFVEPLGAFGGGIGAREAATGEAQRQRLGPYRLAQLDPIGGHEDNLGMKRNLGQG